MSTAVVYSQFIPMNILKLFSVNSNFAYNNLKIIKNGISGSNLVRNKICWKCGKDLQQTKPLCDKCNTIQAPVEKENYFKILGMEESFNIDPVSLRNKFRHLQSHLHPDKFSNKSNEEKNISEEYSSLVNKAYSNLQTPLKRAVHLLKLKGVNIEDDQIVEDPEFLMQVMTLNEEVEDAGTSIEKLKVLNEKNRKQLEKLTQDISEYFKSGDIEQAKHSIIKLKYFSSISGRLNTTLRELGVTD